MMLGPHIRPFLPTASPIILLRVRQSRRTPFPFIGYGLNELMHTGGGRDGLVAAHDSGACPEVCRNRCLIMLAMVVQIRQIPGIHSLTIILPIRHIPGIHSLTIILPKLSPLNNARNASTALSNPSTTVSRLLILPSLIQGTMSSRNWGRMSPWSDTMKP